MIHSALQAVPPSKIYPRKAVECQGRAAPSAHLGPYILRRDGEIMYRRI